MNLEKSKVCKLSVQPRIVPRAEHNISRSMISEPALKVLYRLHNAGYKACLVGGSVRDLLLGREPKDFDVVTDALPEQVRELFRGCRLIGRRFRLAHVRFGRETIEVATFRANQVEHVEHGERVIEDGMIVRDNVYGSIDEDVWRRDFSVNALFYNIADFSVLDYVGGLEDIKAGRLRLIGQPEQRYREDPVRMLRAVRFAVKLGFHIEPNSEEPIRRLGGLLQEIPPARLLEEVMKLLLKGSAVQTFEMLRHYHLFEQLFPQVEQCLQEEDEGFPRVLLIRALENSDMRIAEDKPVTPAFLFAALLWSPMRQLQRGYEANGVSSAEAMHLAADAVIARQLATLAMPRRITLATREIWALQPRFKHRRGKRCFFLLAHPRFRAAYDFLLLRAESGEDLGDLPAWWTEFQEANGRVQEEETAAPQAYRRRGHRRKRN